MVTRICDKCHHFKSMKYLSKRKLKCFANRFCYGERDETGQLKKVHITFEEATVAIEHFISLHFRANELKRSFIETRVKVLKICLEEKSPLERWVKVRDFLVERLDSQVLGAYITQGILQDSEVEPRFVLENILRPDSYLSWCVKVVVLFNVTDDSIPLPEDLRTNFGSGIDHNFPMYTLRQRGVKLIAHTKGGEVIEKYISDPFLEFYKGFHKKYDVKCSILVDQDSKTYWIRYDWFFERFNKLHSDLVKTYKLNSDTKPSEILGILHEDAQRDFLKKLIGNSITKWRWKLEGPIGFETIKCAEEHFPDQKREIRSISWQVSPRWKPDNYLLDEDLLRYELADSYLQRFQPQGREEILIENIRDLSIFNLKSFRELVANWEGKKDFANILGMLKTLEWHYHKHRHDPKEREKWLEYVRIERLIQKEYKPMKAYRLVSPGEKERAVQKRYLRQKEEARKLGYDIKDPKHLGEIKREWNIFETEDFLI